MQKDSKIYIAGHNGLVGSAIHRELIKQDYTNIVFASHDSLDLLSRDQTNMFFDAVKPEYVFLAAAKVGGIAANKNNPADFIYDNLIIQNNVIHASYRHNVKKLLFLGSSCIYPKFSEQPIKEEYLLSGKLEPTNDAYAIAKIAGIIMCKSYNYQYGTNFIAAMPTNLYGQNDNFDLETSHVLPAMINKFHTAKKNNKRTVELWGTGTPRREFLYIDDVADAMLFMMNNFDKDCNNPDNLFLNVGTGNDIAINDLALLVARIVGFDGMLIWNTKMLDGTPRKLLDVSRINDLGWRAKTSLEEGIKLTYEWFLRTCSE